MDSPRPVAASTPTRATTPLAASPAAPSPVPDQLIGFAFNAKTQDVTLFDPATQQVLATRPLGAVVRWLSNEQRWWDGSHIWTYDFPDDTVQAIAVDPREVAIARRLPTGGVGPAHSLMLSSDRKMAWVNVAGNDSLAVLDLATGGVADQVKTGKFP
jgi:hypothetical protein